MKMQYIHVDGAPSGIWTSGRMDITISQWANRRKSSL